MKSRKSFTLSGNVVNILEGISRQSKPHASRSAVVETALEYYAAKINYKELTDAKTNSEEKTSTIQQKKIK